MSFVVRGAKNAFRNLIRTFAIVIILTLSTGLALTMLLARQAVQSRIDSVKSSIGNTITISPAGARGFQGGGEPLLETDLTKVKALPHVLKLTETLNDQLAGTDTNLVTAIDAGTLGARQNRRFQNPDGGGAPPRGVNFTPPIFAVGSDDVTTLQSFGGGTIALSSGDKIDPTSNDNIAMVGKGLADKNSLTVGSTFMAYGTKVTVKGVFDSGNRFSNNLVIFPIKTLQRLSSQTGDVTSAIVQVDSITNLDSTTTAIKTTLGDKADVVSQQDTSNQALAPLENIKKITLYSLLGAVASGAAIIFLTMLMIVRERRREIGVFKAIGSPNYKIVGQFMSEAMVLTLLGTGFGVVAGAFFSNSVVKLLVTSNMAQAPGGPGGGMGGGRFGGGLVRGGQAAIQNIHAVVGYQLILYGLLGAVLIALVGSAIPAYLISKVRPADVMRGE